LEVLGFTSTLGQSGVATKTSFENKTPRIQMWLFIIFVNMASLFVLI
jgi:hypothetical protein